MSGGQAIKVLESQVPPLTKGDGQRVTEIFQIAESNNRPGIDYSGAKLVPSSDSVEVRDMTICTRFNLRVLGGHEGFTYLWTISDWKPLGYSQVSGYWN